MLEPELKTQLEKMDNHLVGIFHKTENLWRAFFRGMLQGIGSVVGIALAILLIGWILNVLGVIPGIRDKANEWQAMWKQTLEQVQKVR